MDGRHRYEPMTRDALLWELRLHGKAFDVFTEWLNDQGGFIGSVFHADPDGPTLAEVLESWQVRFVDAQIREFGWERVSRDYRLEVAE